MKLISSVFFSATSLLILVTTIGCAEDVPQGADIGMNASGGAVPNAGGEAGASGGVQMLPALGGSGGIPPMVSCDGTSGPAVTFEGDGAFRLARLRFCAAESVKVDGKPSCSDRNMFGRLLQNGARYDLCGQTPRTSVSVRVPWYHDQVVHYGVAAAHGLVVPAAPSDTNVVLLGVRLAIRDDGTYHIACEEAGVNVPPGYFGFSEGPVNRLEDGESICYPRDFIKLRKKGTGFAVQYTFPGDVMHEMPLARLDEALGRPHWPPLPNSAQGWKALDLGPARSGPEKACEDAATHPLGTVVDTGATDQNRFLLCLGDAAPAGTTPSVPLGSVFGDPPAVAKVAAMWRSDPQQVVVVTTQRLEVGAWMSVHSGTEVKSGYLGMSEPVALLRTKFSRPATYADNDVTATFPDGSQLKLQLTEYR